jgi:hypothetical protein
MVKSLKSFTVSEDPAILAGVGDAWHFKGVRPGFHPDEPAFAAPTDLGQFEGLLLIVSYSTAEKHIVLGSAVMVAPGIALCVAHVLRVFLDELTAGTVTAMFVGLASHGAEGWKVLHVTTIDRGEICILSFEYMAQLPPNKTFHLACLTTRLPAVGERLYMAGFRAGANEFVRDDAVPAELEAHLLISNGPVVELYPGGLGTYKPWSTLTVDCATIGGMSGGAVFDSRGFLVGLISSSFEIGGGQLPSPTFVALTWSALGTQFPGIWPAFAQFVGSNTLIGLAAGGVCFIERPEAIEQRDVDGQPMSIYSPWT